MTAPQPVPAPKSRPPVAASPARRWRTRALVVTSIVTAVIVGLVSLVAGFGLGYEQRQIETADALATIAAEAQASQDARFGAATSTCAARLGAEARTGVQVGDGGRTLIMSAKEVAGEGHASVRGMACVLGELHAPDSVTARMGQTRALDGTQVADWDGIHASWTYHPDSGMNVVLTLG